MTLVCCRYTTPRWPSLCSVSPQVLSHTPVGQGHLSDQAVHRAQAWSLLSSDQIVGQVSPRRSRPFIGLVDASTWWDRPESHRLRGYLIFRRAEQPQTCCSRALIHRCGSLSPPLSHCAGYVIRLGASPPSLPTCTPIGGFGFGGTGWSCPSLATDISPIVRHCRCDRICESRASSRRAAIPYWCSLSELHRLAWAAARISDPLS